MTYEQSGFKELLRKKGLKITNQRLIILKALEESKGQHLTTEEIYNLVKAEYPEIGLATVYRALQVFSEQGMIDKINFDDGFVRYEMSKNNDDGTHHHHHLICLSCGIVFSFEDDLLEQLEDRIKQTMDFQVVDHEVKLYGYCRNCGRKSC